MEDTINNILDTINHIIHKRENNTYKEVLTKKYDCNIEFVSPIEVTVIPRTIYVFTDHIKIDYQNKLLNFYIKLLHKIHNDIDKSGIKVVEYLNVGSTTFSNNQRLISLIQADSNSFFTNSYDYIISIFTDKLYKSEINPHHFGDTTSVSDINICRITIGQSHKISNNFDTNLSVSINLND